ncbi:hypothetical protein H4R33_004915 [Dimargaris cristalligena]|nr:hypothetical protein H4R33_004915 [Dimargaris cristalligena]
MLPRLLSLTASFGRLAIRTPVTPLITPVTLRACRLQANPGRGVATAATIVAGRKASPVAAKKASSKPKTKAKPRTKTGLSAAAKLALKPKKKKKKVAAKVPSLSRAVLKPPTTYLSPYSVFIKEHYTSYRNQGLAFTEIMVRGSQDWKQLSPAQHQKYTDAAAQARQERSQERAEFLRRTPYSLIKQENSRRRKLNRTGKKTRKLSMIRHPDFPALLAPSGYSLFIRDTCAKQDISALARAQNIRPMNYVAQLWKQLPESEKQTYRQKGKANSEANRAKVEQFNHQYA